MSEKPPEFDGWAYLYDLTWLGIGFGIAFYLTLPLWIALAKFIGD